MIKIILLIAIIAFLLSKFRKVPLVGLLYEFVQFVVGSIARFVGFVLSGIFANRFEYRLFEELFSSQYSQMKKESLEHKKTFIALVTQIAKLDGIISKEEAKFIQKLLDKYSNNPSERAELKKAFLQAKERANDYYLSALELKKSGLYDSLISANRLLQTLKICAEFDGLSQAKVEALIKIAKLFGINISAENSDEQNREQKHSNRQNRGQNSGQNSSAFSRKRACEILGVSQDASENEIKKAYRTMVKKYHPDVLNLKQLSEEERKLANAKFLEITQAYEELLKK